VTELGSILGSLRSTSERSLARLLETFTEDKTRKGQTGWELQTIPLAGRYLAGSWPANGSNLSEETEGLEQYCANGEDKILGGVTYGGYSDSIVVDESLVLRVSPKVNLAATAPLLCAGITTYSPMGHWNVLRKARKWESLAWAARVIWA
jgi:hypothetical protein